MRISIVSSGRFWACDLARELDRLGHDVTLHSLVPPWRTRRFGLPDRCNNWIGPRLAPLLGAARVLSRTRFADCANHLLSVGVDRVASRVVQRCDVLIGLSQLCLATIESARRRFGARAIVERGSRHILSQREILERIARNDSPPVPDWAVHRELAEYALADLIVVPSKHTLHSFVEHGVPAGKLFRNPYGVDLGMFPATSAPPAGAPPTIIMAGLWSLRKGCDVLVDAWRRLSTPDTRLLHVGELGDVPLPPDARFQHHARVDQTRLTYWYGQAHVMALASREEGLALVQAQALASGLRLAATDHTGAEDLQECLEDPTAVAITAVNDVAAFTQALDAQLASARTQCGSRDLLGAARERLTWSAYGKRYDAMLRGC